MARRFQARISEEAHRGWMKVAARTGCTYSALVEALGQLLDEHPDSLPPEVIERAREIDRERRNR